MSEKKMKLSDFVKEKARGNLISPYSVFGEESGGNFLRWTFGLQRFEQFSLEGRHVLIHVPGTESGIAPSCGEAQPYVWDGRINADAAESALWHAFEILTEAEARAFEEAHNPEVIFEYMENYSTNTLRVKFMDGDWHVLDE